MIFGMRLNSTAKCRLSTSSWTEKRVAAEVSHLSKWPMATAPKTPSKILMAKTSRVAMSPSMKLAHGLPAPVVAEAAVAVVVAAAVAVATAVVAAAVAEATAVVEAAATVVVVVAIATRPDPRT